MNVILTEKFLKSCLQKSITLTLNNKPFKKGRLLLYRKNHFFIQITLLNEKQERDNFEIPYPLNIETYESEGLIYFDYRIDSLFLLQPIIITKKISSSYFNKIMEIQIVH